MKGITVQSPTIDQATELLKGRLADIDSERSQIEKALTALSANGSVRSVKRRGRPKGKRSGGGNRAEQAVDLIVANPGISASEIARVMKIKPNYLYRVLKDLAKAGRIKKKGRSYEPGPKAKAAPAKA